MNLVQNPSFEQVSAAPVAAQSGFFGIMTPGGTGWPIRQTAGTTGVPSWTTTTVYGQQYPPALVVDNGTFLPTSTAHGARFAVLPGWLGERPQQLVGTLATPTTAGTTYVLSAAIGRFGMAWAPNVKLWLRNSATGAQSAALLHPSSGHDFTWSLVTGTVSGGVSYDQVVLRFQEHWENSYDPWIFGGPSWEGFADDLRLCKAAAVVRPPGWWTTANVVAAAAALGVLVLGVGWALRGRFRSRGRYSAATVRG